MCVPDRDGNPLSLPRRVTDASRLPENPHRQAPMVRTPDQILWSKELIQTYQVTQSYLRGLVNTEGNIAAKTFTWTIGGTFGEAQERGANGNLLAGSSDYTSVSVVTSEYHALQKNTEFNLATAPVNVRMQMQKQVVSEQNKTTDRLIIQAMGTTTHQPFGATGTVISLSALLKAETIQDQYVVEGPKTWIVTPAFYNQLLKIPQFTSRDYVAETDKPYMKGMDALMWNKTAIVKVPNLPGVGTSAAKCYYFHQQAVGHAFNMTEQDVVSGNNDEHNYCWVRATAMQGAKLILPYGCMEFIHDDASAIAS